QIVLEEINSLRTKKVSEKELKTAVSSISESLPRQFANARAIVNTFADDEYTHRDPKYWSEFQAGVRAVNADAVLRAAQKFWRREQLEIRGVGNLDATLKGAPDKPQFSLEKLAPSGAVVRIPLPDPMTLVYPSR